MGNQSGCGLLFLMGTLKIFEELRKRRRKKQGKPETRLEHLEKQLHPLEFGLLAVSMSVDGIVSGVFAADLPVTGGQIFLPPSRSEWRRCMPELPSEKDGAEKRRKRSTVRRNSVLFTGVFKAHIELHVRKKTSRSRRKIDKPVQICYKVGGLLLENLKTDAADKVREENT